MDSASIAALASSAGLVIGGFLTWLTTRRASSGRVGTSEAAILWQQSQAIIGILTAQRDKAEAQRDRLIESQATLVLPALDKISRALAQITEVLARIETRTAGRGGTGDG